MRSKIFHKFFINQLSANIVLVAGIVFAIPAFSQEKNSNDKFPGVIESLEELIDIDRVRFNKKQTLIASNPKLATELFKVDNFQLDTDFVQSVLFHSDKRFIKLMSENPCGFPALLDTNLLKNAGGKFSDVIVNYSKNDKTELAIMPKKDFLENFYKRECKENERYKSLFSLEKVKNTFSTIALAHPKIENECPAILETWQKDPQMPYLCDVIENVANGDKAQLELMRAQGNPRTKNELTNAVALAESYRKRIPEASLVYFKNVCETLASPVQFCQSYFNQSYWSKVINKQGEKYDLLPRCQNIFKKEMLSPKELETCAYQLNTNNELCLYEKKDTHHSLTPKPTCSLISKALNYSRLYRGHVDCPDLIGNDGIVNTARLLFHLSEDFKKNFSLNSDDKLSCMSNSTAAFAKLTLDFEAKAAWGQKVCYDDTINKVEVCLPIIMGSSPNSPYSEEKQIHAILYKTKGIEKSMKCEVISRDDFNPQILKFKFGCFIIYNPENCYGTNCPKKIFFNEREITHIRYHYSNDFDYFPSSVSKERYAIASLIDNTLSLSSAKITNITSLRFYFNQGPNYIIHGMGCAEDLLPSFFQKETINQCTPITFIVDGLIEKSGRASLVVRTSLDDLHSPRIVDWNYLYSSVRSYQELHPLKFWGLYVIKK